MAQSLANLVREVPVGLAASNACGKVFPQALEAMLARTFGKIEIIVSAEASTDRTGVICRECE